MTTVNAAGDSHPAEAATSSSLRPGRGSWKLAAGYPEIERLGGEFYAEHQTVTGDVLKTMARIGRIVQLDPGASVLVIGCGPNPQSVRDLLDAGFGPAAWRRSNRMWRPRAASWAPRASSASARPSTSPPPTPRRTSC